MKCPTNAFPPCSEGCPGWGWFNGSEVQRCDECRRFESDDAAAEHIAGCAECRAHLDEWQDHDWATAHPHVNRDDADMDPEFDGDGRL